MATEPNRLLLGRGIGVYPLTIFPIVVSLKHWVGFSAPERAAISLYVFLFVSEEVSGSFAFSYDFQFFLALAIGVIALRRKEPAKMSPIGRLGPEVLVQ